MFHPLAVSVQSLWQQSLHDPLELGCYRGQDGHAILARDEAAIADSTANYPHADFALSAGLGLRALNVDIDEADRFIAIGREQASLVRVRIPPFLADMTEIERAPNRMVAFVSWAIGLSATVPVTVPDAALLSQGGRELYQYFSGLRVQFDSYHRGRIATAVMAALAAQDLELANALLNLRKTMPGQHYKWLKAICKGAQTQITPAGPRIKITQAKAVAAFFDLYNAYRLPSAPMFYQQVNEFCVTGQPAIGNYLLSWFYLQSVAQEMPASVDWALLGELMTS